MGVGADSGCAVSVDGLLSESWGGDLCLGLEFGVGYSDAAIFMYVMRFPAALVGAPAVAASSARAAVSSVAASVAPVVCCFASSAGAMSSVLQVVPPATVAPSV